MGETKRVSSDRMNLTTFRQEFWTFIRHQFFCRWSQIGRGRKYATFPYPPGDARVNRPRVTPGDFNLKPLKILS